MVSVNAVYIFMQMPSYLERIWSQLYHNCFTQAVPTVTSYSILLQSMQYDYVSDIEWWYATNLFGNCFDTP